VTTPTLHEQLLDRPDDLTGLIRFLAGRIAGQAAESLADEVESWITQHLGQSYTWPGNIRELEQCVRNVMVRNCYHPPEVRRGMMGGDVLLEGVDAAGALRQATGQIHISADELLGRYCELAYMETGSYEKAARRLGLDRRTVKAKIEAIRQLDS